jgi:hypothetical protein
MLADEEPVVAAAVVVYVASSSTSYGGRSLEVNIVHNDDWQKQC